PVFIPLQRTGSAPHRDLLAALARAHVNGVDVDWARILPVGRRVELPTYAFEHERLWLRLDQSRQPGQSSGPGAESVQERRFWAAVEGGDVQALAETLAVPDQEQLDRLMPMLTSWRRRERAESTTAGWRYAISWTPVAEPPPATLSGVWLVIGDGPATGCSRALSAHGAETISVQLAAGELDREAIAARIGRALDGVAAVTGVVSLLGLDPQPVDRCPVLAVGTVGTLGLVQALGDLGLAAPLWLLTRGAVAAGAGDVLTAPMAAQVWGLGRVAGLEHPDRWGGLVDLPPVWDERVDGRLAAVLAGCGEDQLAIRDAGVLGRRLVRAAPADESGWVPRGTALVTGGTGAIGAQVARWLAERGAERVVLCGRSGAGAPGVAGLAAGLAEAGTDTVVLAADVAQRADVAGLVDAISAAGPPLRSVFHTAGVVDDGVLDRLDIPRLVTVLSAKAGGAALLDELTEGLELDAFVLFSSSAGTFGGGGQGNYAAANAYLDALAENRRARGLTGASLAWGPWAGGGMARADEAVRQRVDRGVLRAMEPSLALRVLGRVLGDAGSSGVVTVMDVDWAQAVSRMGELRRLPFVRDLPDVRDAPRSAAEQEGSGQGGTALTERLAGRSRAERDRILVNLVRTEAATVLGYPSMESVGAGRAFKDLGFDSLTAVELRNRLNLATGQRLPATAIFDYPTATVLAAHLRGAIYQDESTRPPVFGELDALESMLSAFPTDSDIRADVTVRLQTILSKWISADDIPQGNEAAGKLEAATADEVINFINKELGVS
ncbi:MAG TPA: SDR family NAD(P)-dependent oxidoreductase, partial [Pseudonocardia sp.]